MKRRTDRVIYSNVISRPLRGLGHVFLTVFLGFRCAPPSLMLSPLRGLRSAVCLLLLPPACYACLTQRITSGIVAFFPYINMPTR